MYGVDHKGQIYVHVKVFKGGRVFGEIVTTRGDVHLRCRECLRWQRVVIVEAGTARLRTEPKPQVLHNEPSSAGSLPDPDTAS
jgi:hypothetical protein